MPRHLTAVLLATTSIFLLPGCLSRFPNSPLPGGSSSTDDPELTPGVTKSTPGIYRQNFIESDLGTITNILVNPKARVVTLAGTDGVGRWTTWGSPQQSVEFDDSYSYVTIVPHPRGSGYDLLAEPGGGSPKLLDYRGKIKWSGPEFEDEVLTSTAADFMGNGHNQVLTASYLEGGLRLFDGGKKPRWTKPAQGIWFLDSFTDPRTKQTRFVHNNEMDQVVVRNGRGNVISTATLEADPTGLSLCHYPTSTSPLFLLAVEEDTFKVLSFNGRRIKTFQGTDIADDGNARAFPIRLKAGQPPLFAILTIPNTADLSELSIFKADGTLVYREVMPEACGAMAVLPAPKPGAKETLIVGGETQVWKY